MVFVFVSLIPGTWFRLFHNPPACPIASRSTARHAAAFAIIAVAIVVT
jgi:hypothetical protein